jgi:hypothetical protein
MAERKKITVCHTVHNVQVSDDPQGDSNLLSVFLFIVHANPDSTLESLCTKEEPNEHCRQWAMEVWRPQEGRQGQGYGGIKLFFNLFATVMWTQLSLSEHNIVLAWKNPQV